MITNESIIFLKVLSDNIYSYCKRKSISEEVKTFCVYGFSLIQDIYLNNKDNLDIKNIYLRLKHKLDI